MTTRREVLAMLSATPLVVKTDLLSKDDRAVLELASYHEESQGPKEGRSWDGESEMSEVIRSLARRGYLENHDYDGETNWYRLTEKGHTALKEIT